MPFGHAAIKSPLCPWPETRISTDEAWLILHFEIASVKFNVIFCASQARILCLIIIFILGGGRKVL